MIEANKYKLGIFVLTGVALFIMGILMLGLSEALQPKINFITYFDESVQGLDIGSPVKFRGVTIGKVTKILIRPSDNFIRVDMQALPSAIQPTRSGDEPVDFFKHLKFEVMKGLRCRLELQGITGMKYVEMDYLPPDKIKTLPHDPFMNPVVYTIEGKTVKTDQLIPDESTLFVPSTPSLLSGLRTSFTMALSRIASIDFQNLSGEITETLGEAKKLLGDPKITEMIAKINSVAENLDTITSNLNQTLSDERIEQIATELQETLNSVRTLSANAEKQISKAKVADTSAALRELKDEISFTLRKLDNTLDSISELARALDEDPSSIVRGKQPR
ncbi:MAG: MCE family protein [Victivallales bacterium]|nr:MCE family protein [Victivallales bacterium]